MTVDPVAIDSLARRLEQSWGLDEFAPAVRELLADYERVSEDYRNLRAAVTALVEANPHVSSREWWELMDRLARLVLPGEEQKPAADQPDPDEKR